MEFPRLVYLSAQQHQVVHDQTEFDAAIEAGWFASVPECTGKNPEQTPEQEPATMTEEPEIHEEEEPELDIPEPTREELEAKARELGIGFNGNTKDETLLKKIEEILAEQPDTN